MNATTVKAIILAIEAQNTLLERSKIYDKDVIPSDAVAQIMRILFPNGLNNNTRDGTEYKYVLHIVDKLCRFRLNRKKDNIIDLSNYAFLLGSDFGEE